MLYFENARTQELEAKCSPALESSGVAPHPRGGPPAQPGPHAEQPAVTGCSHTEPLQERPHEQWEQEQQQGDAGVLDHQGQRAEELRQQGDAGVHQGQRAEELRQQIRDLQQEGSRLAARVGDFARTVCSCERVFYAV